LEAIFWRATDRELVFGWWEWCGLVGAHGAYGGSVCHDFRETRVEARSARAIFYDGKAALEERGKDVKVSNRRETMEKGLGNDYLQVS
jgi:hypothetical protein